MKIHQAPLPKARIEMIPLIDSFFLILVYFIYSFLTMSVHRGVPLTLPFAKTAVEQKSEHYGISITKEGDIYFNRQLISIEDLDRQMQVLLRTQPRAEDIQIYIYGDKDAKHGLVMSILDLLRERGIKKVNIETQVE